MMRMMMRMRMRMIVCQLDEMSHLAVLVAVVVVAVVVDGVDSKYSNFQHNPPSSSFAMVPYAAHMCVVIVQVDRSMRVIPSLILVPQFDAIGVDDDHHYGEYEDEAIRQVCTYHEDDQSRELTNSHQHDQR